MQFACSPPLAVQTTCCVSCWSLVGCIWAMLEILEKRSGPWVKKKKNGRSFWLVNLDSSWQVPELFLFVFLCLGCITILLGQLAMSRDSQLGALSCTTAVFVLGLECICWIQLNQVDSLRLAFFSVFRQLFGGLATWNLQLGREHSQDLRVGNLSNSIHSAVGMGKSSENPSICLEMKVDDIPIHLLCYNPLWDVQLTRRQNCHAFLASSRCEGWGK